MPKLMYFQEFSLRFGCTHRERGGNAKEAKANHCKSHGCSCSCNIFVKNTWYLDRFIHISLPYNIINYGIFSTSQRKHRLLSKHLWALAFSGSLTRSKAARDEGGERHFTASIYPVFTSGV